MEYYYADKSNTPKGPVTKSNLDELMTAGEICPTTSVIAVGENAWSTHEKLFGGLDAATTPPPPPKEPERLKISQQAASIAANAVKETSEFNNSTLVELPAFLKEVGSYVFQTIANLRFAVPKDERLARIAEGHTTFAVYVVTIRPKWCNWRSVTLSGGINLDFTDVKHSVNDGSNLEEHVIVHVPMHEMERNLYEGIKFRLSGEQELIITVPSDHVQAALYLLNNNEYSVDESAKEVTQEDAEVKPEIKKSNSTKVTWITLASMAVGNFVGDFTDFGLIGQLVLAIATMVVLARVFLL